MHNILIKWFNYPQNSQEESSRDFSPQLLSILGMQKASRPAELHEQFLAEKKEDIFPPYIYLKHGAL